MTTWKLFPQKRIRGRKNTNSARWKITKILSLFNKKILNRICSKKIPVQNQQIRRRNVRKILYKDEFSKQNEKLQSKFRFIIRFKSTLQNKILEVIGTEEMYKQVIIDECVRNIYNLRQFEDFRRKHHPKLLSWMRVFEIWVSFMEQITQILIQIGNLKTLLQIGNTGFVKISLTSASRGWKRSIVELPIKSQGRTRLNCWEQRNSMLQLLVTWPKHLVVGKRVFDP